MVQTWFRVDDRGALLTTSKLFDEYWFRGRGEGREGDGEVLIGLPGHGGYVKSPAVAG